MVCLLLIVRKKEKRRETAEGLFSQGQTCLAGCAARDFCHCSVQLMAD
jgi:hypothetical protein